MFSLAPILIHSEAVPEKEREALRHADYERAAEVLYRETDLDCRDVRELVGLGAGDCTR